MPAERDIEKLMRDTGMERVQAINHLRGRAAVLSALQRSGWRIFPEKRA